MSLPVLILSKEDWQIPENSFGYGDGDGISTSGGFGIGSGYGDGSVSATAAARWAREYIHQIYDGRGVGDGHC